VKNDVQVHVRPPGRIRHAAGLSVGLGNAMRPRGRSRQKIYRRLMSCFFGLLLIPLCSIVGNAPQPLEVFLCCRCGVQRLSVEASRYVVTTASHAQRWLANHTSARWIRRGPISGQVRSRRDALGIWKRQTDRGTKGKGSNRFFSTSVKT